MTPNPWTYQVTALRVVDGDTVDVTLDLGFHMRLDGVILRLDGVNAAEHATPAGDAATKWLTELCAPSASAPNPKILVTTRLEGKADKWGRILAKLYVNAIDVTALGLQLGYYLPYTGTGPKPVPSPLPTP